MSDRLEDFVKQHQEQFDLHEPDPSIWLKINPDNASVMKERNPMRWLRVAAAIAMIFAGSTAGFYFLTGNRAETDQLSNELYMEMQETEEYYSNELKEDLRDNASNPEVIEAMIVNYRVKLEILEDLLHQLKEKENQDYESDGSYSL